MTRYSISVDQFFFPNKDAEKNTQRRQLDALLDSMSDDGLEIVTATAQKVVEVEKKHEAAAEWSAVVLSSRSGSGEVIAEIRASEQLRGFWKKYQRDFDYAKDISFDDACDTIQRIMENIIG